MAFGNYMEQEKGTALTDLVRTKAINTLDRTSKFAGKEGNKTHPEQEYINKDTIISIEPSQGAKITAFNDHSGWIEDSSVRVHYNKDGQKTCALFSYSISPKQVIPNMDYRGSCDKADFDPVQVSKKYWLMLWISISIVVASMMYSDLKNRNKAVEQS